MAPSDLNPRASSRNRGDQEMVLSPDEKQAVMEGGGDQKRRWPLSLLLLALFLSILVPLLFLSWATASLTAEAGPYRLLLLLNVAIGIGLFVVVLLNLLWLYRCLKRRVAGALTARKLILLFGGLALFPAATVFSFALQFLDRSIDSWFDLQIDRALGSALQLTKRVVAVEAQRLKRESEQLRPRIEASLSDPDLLPIVLEEVRRQLEASEVAVLTTRGEIVALSGAETLVLPSLPDPRLLLQARREGGVAVLDPTPEPLFSKVRDLAIRVVIPLREEWILQLIRPLPTQLLTRAVQVEEAYGQYRQMAYFRQMLKLSFSLTLALILLVSLLAAFWAAFLSTRRLVQPIQILLEGTRSVAKGDFKRRLPVTGRDDMGQLIAAFNTMTCQLEAAQEAEIRSRRQLEEQRTYLEAVLGNLTSGVITLSQDGHIEVVNQAASEMLGVGQKIVRGERLDFLVRLRPELRAWVGKLRDHLLNAQSCWQFELPVGGRMLLTRGGPIRNRRGEPTGNVVVLDDITALVQAQKRAAWSEMARRLAHEIKNPLTPIQLAAERLHHKLRGEVSEEGAKLLERSTLTIIQQVETLKGLASAFSDFARPPKLKPEPVDLKAFFDGFTTLYPPPSGVGWHLEIPEGLPEIEADPAALRQLFHNLTKNAIEAKGGEVVITVQISPSEEGVVIRFRDNGPGIAPEIREQIFDPYVTTKTRGSGLGLAIARRIVEEHGGRMTLEEGRWTTFRIELPWKIPKSEGNRGEGWERSL